MRVQFLTDTLIGKTTYTPAAGVVEVADDAARRCIERRLAVAAPEAIAPPAAAEAVAAPDRPGPAGGEPDPAAARKARARG